MDIFEYNEDDETTWVIREAPPLDPDFEAKLLEIGGTNPFGGPMLRAVWGATHRAKGILVYKLCDTPEMCTGYQYRDPETNQMVEMPFGSLGKVPAGAVLTTLYGSLELGELRWMIERWVSTRQLERMGYFDESLRNVVIERPVDARYAKDEFFARVDSGEDAEVALAKVEGELDRQRTMKVDDTIKTFFDPEHRAKGDYELFLKLERRNGMYHPADGEALEGIAAMWVYNETTPVSQVIADEKATSEKRRAEVQRRISEMLEPENVVNYKQSEEERAYWANREVTEHPDEQPLAT